MYPIDGRRASFDYWVRPWSIVAAILLIGTAAGAAFEAFLLEMLVDRPVDGGSMTTLLPATTYASATVMKVCGGAGGLAGLVAFVGWTLGLGPSAAEPRRPGLAILSTLLPPLTLVTATVVVLAAQAFAGTAPELLLADFRRFGRLAVFAMMGVLGAGVVVAVAGWRRGERPGALAAFGATLNVVLLWLFQHFHFYARHFDQDTWAGPN